MQKQLCICKPVKGAFFLKKKKKEARRALTMKLNPISNFSSFSGFVAVNFSS